MRLNDGIPRGLSPRVRGIRARSGAPITATGSIPACTGNPFNRRATNDALTVYPRVYGESPESQRDLWNAMGLSPRVRGIPYLPVESLR